jgi:proteasome-associated ATPase
MDQAKLRELENRIVEAIQLNDYAKAYKLIESIAESSVNADRDRGPLEAKIQELEQKLKDLREPPLKWGLILGPSPDDESNVLIGCGGQRLEVRIAAEATSLKPKDLQPGWEAWLNQDHQITKVRPPSMSGEASEILAILDDGRRLRVKGRGSEEIVVDPIASLTGLRVGDLVRIDTQLAVALEKLPQQENKELELEAVPDVTYADIGGLDEHIEQIREAIELPYLYHHLFAQYVLRRPKGILLYGPPGCGKTLIAKAIANSLTREIERNTRNLAETLSLLVRLRASTLPPAEMGPAYAAWHQEVYQRPSPDTGADPSPARVEEDLRHFLATRGVHPVDLEAEHQRAQARLQERPQAYFMSIKGPELLNKWVGETEQSIRKLFLQAKRRASPATPVIMFFDEIEALFRRRGSRVSSDMESTVVPQFLSEMDGVEELVDVIIIGATNRQDLLDPAILRPGRLDAKIKINRPGREASRAIFGKYLVASLPIAEDEVAAAGSLAAALESLIDRAVAVMFSDVSQYHVAGQQVEGGKKSFRLREFVSGAMIESVVSRCKRRALKREIDSGERGLHWALLLDSIREEFEQNKDQLVSTNLNLSEEGLTIELVLARDEKARQQSPWLRPLERPWAARPRVAAVN